MGSKNIIRIEEGNKICRTKILKAKNNRQSQQQKLIPKKEKTVERIDVITKSLSRKYFNKI
ncbi:MAG: hypothetical protein ACPKQO_11025 [Nitrososphaeraceae archaeon]